MVTLVRLLLLITLIILIPFDIGCRPVIEPKPDPIEIIIGPVAVNPIEEVPAHKPKVFLFTLDGVRWQEIFNGTDHFLYLGHEILNARQLLPNLYTIFVDKGMVVGKHSNFIATGPRHISLPGYLEIMRGHPSTDCQFNDCKPPILKETIADLFDESAVIASWDTIKHAVSDDPEKFTVNCGRNYRTKLWNSYNLQDNKTFAEFFDPEYRPDGLTWVAVLVYLKEHNPDFLWVSFGDTDEWAHAGNYPEYIVALQNLDKHIGDLITMLAGKPGFENYTFIVTADHGRNLHWRDHGPEKESERDWLMMYGRGIPAKGFVSYPTVKSLSNIKPTVKFLVTGNPDKNSLL